MENEIIKDTLIMANSIASNTLDDYAEFSDYYKDKYQKILNYSYEQVCELYKKNKRIAYCDIITISINGSEPQLYYLCGIRDTSKFCWPISVYSTNEKIYTSIETDQILSVYNSAFARELLNRYEGETFTYQDDGKNEQVVKVLSIRKTVASTEISKEEAEAYVLHKKK